MSQTINESVFTDPGTIGNTFSLQGNQYQYNWSTKNLPASYWYKIFVKLDDGTIQSTIAGLK